MVGDGGLVAFLVGHGVGVVANVDLNVVVAVLVGRGGVDVFVVEFIGTGDGHGDTLDRGLAVLLVGIAVDAGGVAVAAHLHFSIVREVAFAFVINGSHIEDIAIHVVGQFASGNHETGLTDLVDGGLADLHAILVDVVVTIGAVDNGVPGQGNGLAFEDFVRCSNQVLRLVEVRGEAKHFASHGAAAFFFATVATLVDTPEVVGVVEEVGDSV